MSRLSDAHREAFLRQLNIGVGNITEFHALLINETNRLLLANPSPTNIARIHRITELYDKLLLETRPEVLREFQREMMSMSNVGADHVLSALADKEEIAITAMSGVLEEIMRLSVNELLEKIYPDGLTLSDRIWRPEQRSGLLKEVQRGYLEGLSPFEIAERVNGYMKKGRGFADAYRLAHTELVRTYSQTKLDSVRAWNSSPSATFKMYIRQELSPLHPKYDICDVLAGDYDPDGYVPPIPRHPNCLCKQSEVFIKGASEKQDELPMTQLIDAEGGGIEEIYQTSIQEGAKSRTKGPIDVVKTDDGFMILDGHHRATEAFRKGDKTIVANILSAQETMDKYGELYPHLEAVLDLLGDTRITTVAKQMKKHKKRIKETGINTTVI